MNDTWIEVALNGPWTRQLQPRVPIGVDEIVADGIACARAGAAIVHVHAFDASGSDDTTGEIYAAVIDGIRSEVDCLIYPSIPISAAPGVERFGHLTYLLERGLLEMTVVDPGSVNLNPAGDETLPYPSLVYANSPQEIAEGLDYCAQYGIHPGYAIYEPGFTRTGAAMAMRRPGVPEPIYRFMFSDGLTFGFRPGPAGVDAHLAALESEAPGAPWMVAGLDFDVLSVAAHAISRGGGVRTGLEDARFGSPRSNVELVEQLMEMVLEVGATPAMPADIRADLRARRSTKESAR